jgi:MOB kinase activator 1
LLYGILADNCTAKACPTMCGGAKYEYLWQDGIEFKKPTRLPAKVIKKKFFFNMTRFN